MPNGMYGSGVRGRKTKATLFSSYSIYLCFVGVIQISKAMQATAIGTVAKSLPKNIVYSFTIFLSFSKHENNPR